MNKKKKFTNTLLTLSILILASCSQQLTRNKAIDSLEESKELSLRRSQTTITVGDVRKTEDIHSFLIEKGWLMKNPNNQLIVTEQGSKNMVPFNPGGQQMSLLLPFGLSGSSPVTSLYKVPVGRIKLLEVTGIKEESETKSEVEFSYQWEFTELGQQIAEVDSENIVIKSIKEGKVKQSRATFEKYDDGWRLTKINETY